MLKPTKFLIHSWRNLSIAKKLYAVLGVMSVLIAGELIVLRFSMRTLSAVRAFVEGEGLWSKAQKNAALSLRSYALTRDEADFRKFLGHFRIAEGDRLARMELEKPEPDFEKVRAGFLQGGIHPSDIEPISELLRRFYWVSYIQRAVQAWKGADEGMERLKAAGDEYHRLLQATPVDVARIRALSDELYELNEQLTELESEFSRALGEGSRWLESVVITLLFLAVLFVESIGITMTILTTRSLSRRMKELGDVSEAVGRGEFTRKIAVDSQDEIGVVADSVNRMGDLLKKSYSDLERRVHERTQELEKLVRVRDEFLSMASHELKTPITSLKLQMQMRIRSFRRAPEAKVDSSEVARILEDNERQVNRLVRLVEEMLDVSRLNAGKFSLSRESLNLGDLVEEVVLRMEPSLKEAGCSVEKTLDRAAIGQWDRFRMEQVLINLLTNAIRYGAGTKIEIRLESRDARVVLTVKDGGMGIAPEDQSRIFHQFERAVSSGAFGGLGLGLYIVHSIVEAHGGTISVESALGAGALFTIMLPLDGRAETAEKAV